MSAMPMGALQKIPSTLLNEITSGSLRIQNNAAAIYDLLDQKQGPVKVEEIQKQLGIGLQEYRSARHLLMGTSAELYVTQDGVILKKYLSTDEQRFWHLAWSLGLFMEAGEQLVLDTDLLQKVPHALVKLLEDGKFREHGLLAGLRTKTQKAVGTLLKVMDMYKQVQKAIDIVLLPQVKPGDWKKMLADVRKQLPPG